MKNAGLLAICLASMLCPSVAVSGQKTVPYNRLDITLEGPWILYKDTGFTNSVGMQVPVLIAIAPSMLMIEDVTIQQKRVVIKHQPPTLMAGDGFQVKQGINCLIFDGVCGEVESTNPLLSFEYPIESILRVSAKPNWEWYSDASTTNGYYVILPWPDSLSNDGTWPMRFSPTSDSSATDEDAGEYKVSGIGVHLHYYDGPKKFSLGLCTQFSSDNATTCALSDVENKSIANTGTIRLTMKAPYIPDPDAVCDPHVRAAYRQMLLLLDPTDFVPRDQNSSKNINQDIAWIDPARGVNPDNTAVADDKPIKCRDLYDSGLPASLSDVKANTTQMHPMTDQNESLYDLFKKIAVIKPAKLADQTCQPGEKVMTEECALENQLKVVQDAIAQLSSKMDPVYPRLSQLALAAALAKTSQDLITKTDSARNETHAPLSQTKKASGTFSQLELSNILINLDGLEETYVRAYDQETKDGKDCRAPIAIVKP